MQTPLLTITIKDCDVQDFTAGGPGGQHQNRRSTAVRVVHRLSGAIGESREFKSQIQNKRAAFTRMANSAKFQAWIRLEAAKRMGQPSIEERVEATMTPNNLRVEVRNEKGQWENANG